MGTASYLGLTGGVELVQFKAKVDFETQLGVRYNKKAQIALLLHDKAQVITMLVWIPSGWCATLVVRNCCALTKNMAQACNAWRWSQNKLVYKE
eukprot:4672860-Amphidinium_carterae.1